MKRSLKDLLPTFLYDPHSLALTLDVHKNTIFKWRKEGLKSEEDSGLFLGSNVKKFLLEKKVKRKTKLRFYEFYCLKCKSATLSKPTDLEYCEIGKLFLSNETKIIIRGKCCNCSRVINRFASGKQIADFKEFYKKE